MRPESTMDSTRTGSWPALLLAITLGLMATQVRADLEVWAPSDMPIGKTVTATQLWQVFDGSLPPGVWISPLENAEYGVISAKWMRRTFLPAAKRQMHSFWDQRVAEENSAGNCNGFAMVFRLMLGLSAMDSHAPAPATATVIVRQENPFGGLSATKENHCVAFVLTDEGPWIVEVQSGAYVPIRDYPNRENIKFVNVH
jgi:hypothetical protein